MSSRLIFEGDSVVEKLDTTGHRGIVKKLIHEKGLRLAEVRWQNGVTTHQSLDSLYSLGNVFTGL